MKAVVFKAPYELAIENVDDPKIEHPRGPVLRITTANICASPRSERHTPGCFGQGSSSCHALMTLL